MAKKKRKVGFYILNNIRDNKNVFEDFKKVINYINSLDKQEKKINLSDNKFGFLSGLTHYDSNKRTRLLLKSAYKGYRPPLVDSDTVDERDNPKNKKEGEINKTHVIIKETNDGVLLLLEKTKIGMSINQLVSYLNEFALLLDEKKSIIFSYDILVSEDFMKEVKELKRIVCADVFVDKQLLGPDVLNFSNQTSTVQHEVMISVKANRNDSIADFAKDVYSNISSFENQVRRLRVVGRNQENNEVKINTDFIEKIQYVKSEINPDTGEVSTSEIFIEMETVVHNF